MTRNFTFAALIAAATVAAAPAPAAAQASPDVENAHLMLSKAFEAAWNAHDMAALGKLVTADVDWVNSDGSHNKGRDQVIANFSQGHAAALKDSVLATMGIQVAQLKPDTAVAHLTWSLRGDRNADGSIRPPHQGIFTWVTVRQGGAWKIRASQNTSKQAAR